MPTTFTREQLKQANLTQAEPTTGQHNPFLALEAKEDFFYLGNGFERRGDKFRDEAQRELTCNGEQHPGIRYLSDEQVKKAELPFETISDIINSGKPGSPDRIKHIKDKLTDTDRTALAQRLQYDNGAIDKELEAYFPGVDDISNLRRAYTQQTGHFINNVYIHGTDKDESGLPLLGLNATRNRSVDISQKNGVIYLVILYKKFETLGAQIDSDDPVTNNTQPVIGEIEGPVEVTFKFVAHDRKTKSGEVETVYGFQLDSVTTDNADVIALLEGKHLPASSIQFVCDATNLCKEQEKVAHQLIEARHKELVALISKYEGADLKTKKSMALKNTWLSNDDFCDKLKKDVNFLMLLDEEFSSLQKAALGERHCFQEQIYILGKILESLQSSKFTFQEKEISFDSMIHASSACFLESKDPSTKAFIAKLKEKCPGEFIDTLPIDTSTAKSKSKWQPKFFSRHGKSEGTAPTQKRPRANALSRKSPSESPSTSPRPKHRAGGSEE